jgi:RNA polymerase sigma-70 factor (ECF subfamily)
MLTETDDETLAKRAGTGDREAFEGLLERHYDRVYRIGYRLLGNTTEAEDLAQEICVGLVKKLKSYRGDSRFTTWLYRVVVNAARDGFRRRASADRLDKSFSETAALVEAGHQARRSDARWLYGAIDSLSDDLRETALLVLSEELKHAEVGEVLGVKEATVSWRMHEVRRKLKVLAEAGDGGAV